MSTNNSNNPFYNKTIQKKNISQVHRDTSNNVVTRQQKLLSNEDNSLFLSQSSLSPKVNREKNGLASAFQIPTMPLFNASSNNVKVVCRFRPLNDKEKQLTKELCFSYLDHVQVEIKSKNEYNNFAFQFDRMFNLSSTQKEIYDYAAKDLVDSVLDGYNATIFAYGQTASGKTYTMQGLLNNPEKEGITPRMVRHIFHHILCSNGDIEFTVKVSMIELYMEKIKDLLDSTKVNLNIRETKDKMIYIEDLSEHYVSTEEEVLDFIRRGNENRTVSSTQMNDSSNRSHTLLIVSLHQKNNKTLEAKAGKLYIVDLAGSEKIAKTGSSGLTLEEAKIINKSLTTLGMVINALTDGKSSHIPYRESKLTRVLTESLGGNAKTCLIITCSPSQYNESETLSTLRFGTRAKKIKNTPKINKEITVPELKLQIERLEKILVLCTNRINKLEIYIKENNLQIPPSTTNESNNEENNPDLLNQSIKTSSGNLELGTKMKDIEIKYSDVLGKISGFEESNKDIMEKLEEANLKIADLQAIIEQKEKIEEEFETKEQQYNTTINQLTDAIKNIQSKEVLKTNLKLIDKHTLEEFHSQMKDYLFAFNKANAKASKDISSKILDSMFHIINSNLCTNHFNTEERKILSNRLSLITVNKFEFLSNGNMVDYKDINDNLLLHNNTNEALLKSVAEKNERIKRLEGDLKEYKERIDLLEIKLLPEDKNLYKKIYTLEKNLEQVNAMFHQVVTQKSVLKIENQVLEKKIKKRNEKLCTLVKENYGLLEQLKMRDDKLSFYQKTKNTNIPQVVKVLRGSGNKSSNCIEQITHN